MLFCSQDKIYGMIEKMGRKMTARKGKINLYKKTTSHPLPQENPVKWPLKGVIFFLPQPRGFLYLSSSPRWQCGIKRGLTHGFQDSKITQKEGSREHT